MTVHDRESCGACRIMAAEPGLLDDALLLERAAGALRRRMDGGAMAGAPADYLDAAARLWRDQAEDEEEADDREDV